MTKLYQIIGFLPGRYMRLTCNRTPVTYKVAKAIKAQMLADGFAKVSIIAANG